MNISRKPVVLGLAAATALAVGGLVLTKDAPQPGATVGEAAPRAVKLNPIPANEAYRGIEAHSIELDGVVRRTVAKRDYKILRKKPPIPDHLVSKQDARALQREARGLPADASIRNFRYNNKPQRMAPMVSELADGIDANTNASATGFIVTPPDPEMAAGDNHVLVAVNTSFAIYDKASGSRLELMSIGDFFSGTGCGGVFDPNTVYDEKEDRFILAVSDGSNYCVAATKTSDPTGDWWAYVVPTNVNGAFFDYPHAGVGDEAIFVGANMFGAEFEGRVWALDKSDLYSGAPLDSVSMGTGIESTPQPMNLHGWDQGTWPTSGPHYIVTDDQFDGQSFGVWSWDDPFGSNAFVDEGALAWPGGGQGFPLPAPMAGGEELSGNDWRVLDAEYRNGSIWTVHGVSCNPGGGTVNCIQWAEFDPASMTVLQGGVFSRSGGYYIFPDLAVNHCEDAVIGYTGTLPGRIPSTFLAGRLGSQPADRLTGDVRLKIGEDNYSSFDGSPYRWGDYTGATSDPNGSDVWYLGQFSRDSGVDTNWATTIGKVSFDCSS